MTARDIPPSRTHLAAMLRVLARSPAHFGIDARHDLLEYLKIAEDTIEAQAAMVRADLADLDAAKRRRHELSEVIGAMGLECDRLKAENADLRKTTLADFPKSLEQTS